MKWNEVTFGVEIESLIPSRTDVAGLFVEANCRVSMLSGYSHTTTPGWKRVTDASLQPPAGFIGAEFVSPVLKGEAGVDEVKRLCSALQAAGTRINQSCGLHVHVGARNATPQQVANLAKLFVKYESLLESLIPASRRGNANRLIQSNGMQIARAGMDKRAAIEALGRATTVRRVAEIINGGWSTVSGSGNPYRYFKFNVQSYATHGTIEFRMHGGSVDGEKIAAWVKLVTALAAFAYTVRSVESTDVTFEDLLRKVDRQTAAYLRQRQATLNPPATANP